MADDDLLPGLAPLSPFPAPPCPTPRFPPASPHPTAPDAPHTLNPHPASQLSALSPRPPLLTAQPLPASPDVPALASTALPSSPLPSTALSNDAPLSWADTRQSETSEYSDVLQSIPALTPRFSQQKDEEFSPDCQGDCNAPDKFAQPPRFFSASPLPSEPGRRNALKGQWRAGIVLIIATFCLIFASLGGYIVLSGHLPGRNISQTVTKTTSINRTINVRATATAKAATTNPYVSGGTLIFSDTLKAANSNWDQNTDCTFKGSSYHVTAITIQSCTLNANVTLTNFVLEVKATLLQGNIGGFFFRENKIHNRSNAYLLDFDNKGGYQLWNYSASKDAALIDYGTSNNLNTGYNQANIIALVVQGSSMILYVNGHAVKHFTDHIYNSGGLSLVASEYSPHTGVSEVAYSDLRLWQL
ncbi:MAG TPA: hypothetical protein VF458_19785 [Ktedonobacteraceae bacterium]